jgi:hypothetical protein
MLLSVLLGLPLAAQDFTVASLSRHTLTNEGVVTLAKAGFDELFIFERIVHSRTRFDTTVEGMVALKQAGVSEDLIRVMAARDVRPFPIPGDPASSPLPPAPAASRPPSRVVVDKHWWGFHWVTVTP